MTSEKIIDYIDEQLEEVSVQHRCVGKFKVTQMLSKLKFMVEENDKVWNRFIEEDKNTHPPIGTEVAILYKDRDDDITKDNLYHGTASRVLDYNFHYEKWSKFTEYQGYYEVVYWAYLYPKPDIEEK